MMRSEFEQLSGIFPSTTLWNEIEKLYMESDKNKVDFAKAFKRNKDGIAEIARDRAIKTQFKENHLKEQQLDELSAKVSELASELVAKEKALEAKAKELEELKSTLRTIQKAVGNL